MWWMQVMESTMVKTSITVRIVASEIQMVFKSK